MRRHISDDFVNRSSTYLLNEWINLNYSSPKASTSRFKKNLAIQFYENLKDQITRNPRLSDEEKLKNPETIHPQDYLDESELPFKLKSDFSNVTWSKCEWQNVKGMHSIFKGIFLF